MPNVGKNYHSTKSQYAPDLVPKIYVYTWGESLPKLLKE